MKKPFHIHLVSDATGETINNIARACLAQFADIEPQEHFWSLIRTPRQLDLVTEGIRQWPGMVLYTFVDEKLRKQLQKFCNDEKLPGISVLDPVLTAMASYFGVSSAREPGRQHALDADYFARIDAMDFALAQDDGHGAARLAEADVLILGVSRTSKTPTCIYLANRGIKAANIPLIPDQPFPDIESLTKPLIIGLTKDPDSLVEIRRNRLKLLNEKAETHYTDPEKVHEEVQNARRFFARIGCPVIDVSRRSIEETAAEIMMLLNRRSLERSISTVKAQTEKTPMNKVAPKAGVMGWPIGHSLSPRLHTYWLKQYNIVGSYEALAVEPDNIGQALRDLPGKGFCGVNLTVPHKEKALGAMSRLDDAAQRIGAVNTVIVHNDGTLEGRNTDAYGFAQNLIAGGVTVKGKPVLVLGAGGAARAVIVALQDMGAGEIRLANRTQEKADRLAKEFNIKSLSWDHASSATKDAGLLVNTTLLGMKGQPPLEIVLDNLPLNAAVSDIVYVPLMTGLLQQAQKSGHKIVDGLGMLLHQARPAFAAFFGKDPEVTADLRRHILEPSPLAGEDANS